MYVIVTLGHVHTLLDFLTFAFLYLLRMPFNFWFPSGINGTNKIHTPQHLGPYLENLPWPSGLMAVDSAFEMTAIYRMDMIRNTTARYNGTSDGSGHADCEHVAFNLGLRKQYNARLRLSRLIYCQGDEGYQPLPANLTDSWSDYVSYNKHSISSEDDSLTSSNASHLRHDQNSSHWNVVWITKADCISAQQKDRI